MSDSRNDAADTTEPKARGYGFGTFKGVYTPSVLTILGIIMYLRFGWVLGNVGLGLTLLIVTMSTAITFLTGLALSTMATNMKVGGGGAYYIISRSLGVEAGAAIGVPLFFAQTLSIAFYVCGFTEAFIDTVPQVGIIENIVPGVRAFDVVAVATLVGLTALSRVV